MPKMKTHSGTAKRIKTTGGGKLKRRRAYVSHLLEHKSVARKRAKHGVDDLAKADVRRARKLLGEG
ncbi:MAG TPA: 50S ribosomal protein L35 [Patescibacteria group bacterium]|jgi:large subunit ribosomal protein L35